MAQNRALLGVVSPAEGEDPAVHADDLGLPPTAIRFIKSKDEAAETDLFTVAWNRAADEVVVAELRLDRAFPYGSAMRQGANFFDTAVRVCRRMGRRGVLLAPQDEQIPAVLPPDVIHVPHAPLSMLLPRCVALIHHGGIGTVAHALAVGLPQLVVPVAFDHFDEGRRLSERDLGAVLSRFAFRPGQAARVLNRLLTDPTVMRACARARMRMEEADDVFARACDAVEDLHASQTSRFTRTRVR